MKNEVLNGGEAHKSNIETAKQLVPFESRNVARRDQFSFTDAFTYFEQKTFWNFECGLQKRKIMMNHGKLSFHINCEGMTYEN